MIVRQEASLLNSPVFLSSSMACRDFDAFATTTTSYTTSNTTSNTTSSTITNSIKSTQLEKEKTHDKVRFERLDSGEQTEYEGYGNGSSGGAKRTDSGVGLVVPRSQRIGCNRGANGIDGVLSTAVGYAFGTSRVNTPFTVLIGDVATIHDISGVSIAAGTSPGYINDVHTNFRVGRVGKIVCVNNSGGAIFSFLPAAKHRFDFFSPYLDTPHSLNLSNIATSLANNTDEIIGENKESRNRGMLRQLTDGQEEGVSLTSSEDLTRKCVRVTTVGELEAALKAPDVFFVECYGLPNHEQNVELHAKMAKDLVEAVDQAIEAAVRSELKWEFYPRVEGDKEVEKVENEVKDVEKNEMKEAVENKLGASKSNQISVPVVIDQKGSDNINSKSMSSNTINSNNNNDSPMNESISPLVVYLHGWMGSQQDWKPIINEIRTHRNKSVEFDANRSDSDSVFDVNFDTLTVDSGGDIMCPAAFCRALRGIIQKLPGGFKIPCISTSSVPQQQPPSSSNTTFSSTLQPVLSPPPISSSSSSSISLSTTHRSLIFIGYSQGARLAMHYRSMFPNEILSILTLSTAPGKGVSTQVEDWTLRTWGSITASKGGMGIENEFLKEWYNLPIFSNLASRQPTVLQLLINQRLGIRFGDKRQQGNEDLVGDEDSGGGIIGTGVTGVTGIDIQHAIRNMCSTTATRDSLVEAFVMGCLDEKYVQLGRNAATKPVPDGARPELIIIPNCGHALLQECGVTEIRDIIIRYLSFLSLKNMNNKSNSNSNTIKYRSKEKEEEWEFIRELCDGDGGDKNVNSLSYQVKNST